MIVPPPQHSRDLAPGDQRSADFDWEIFQCERVDHPDDPVFQEIYDVLAEIFLPLGEMETVEILQQRLGWQGRMQPGGFRFSYHMIALKTAGQIAAVRDHSVIVSPENPAAIFVHLSHLWIAPAWRRSGLAGWMRALPVADARAAGLPEATPITLIAEMEPLEEAAQLPRLAAYARAGFRRVDPALVKYQQPDFRPFAEIDASGGSRPLPFWLLLRLVGREAQSSILGDELQRLVGALYALYGAGFREQDMAPLYRRLRLYPSAETSISLENYQPVLP